MSLDAIRNRLSSHGGESDLIDLLPSHELMRWMYYPGANASSALVVGTDEHADLLAFAAHAADGQTRVEYVRCSGDIESAKALTQEEVMQLALCAPFKYNASTSPHEQANFRTVIEWYLFGLVENNLTYDLDEYCPRFSEALRNIEVGQLLDQEAITSIQRTAVLPPDQTESTLDSRSACRTAVNRTSDAGQGTTRRSTTQTGFATSQLSDGSNSDLRKLLDYLDRTNTQGLLAHIPAPSDLHFEEQEESLQDALPKKLLVGYEKTTRNTIFAYMRRTREFHAVHFYAESSHGKDRQVINAGQLVQHEILHPFDKSYPEDTFPVDAKDRARLTLLVKWYFIAAGVVTDRVLKETKDYPRRLRDALEYIAQRTEPAEIIPTDEASIEQTASELLGKYKASSSSDKGMSPFSSPPTTPCQWSTANEELPLNLDDTKSLVQGSAGRTVGDAGTEEDATTEDVSRWILSSIAEAESVDREELQLEDEMEQQHRALQQRCGSLQNRHKRLLARRALRKKCLKEVKTLMVEHGITHPM